MSLVAFVFAATLHVAVEPRPAVPIEIAVGDAKKTLAPDAPFVTFEHLDAGSYTILVRGAGPLERAIGRGNVGRGDTRKVTVALPRTMIEGRFFLGNAPLANAKIHFVSHEHGWDSELHADREGRVRAVSWSREAVVFAYVSGGPLRSPYTARLDFSRDAAFDIRIPERRLRGSVLDADGAPLPNVEVALRAPAGEVITTAKQTTDDRGTFEFIGLHPGEHTLNVLPRGGVRPPPIAIAIAEKDAIRTVNVNVDGGLERVVEVRGHDGRPIAGAKLIAFGGGKATTDGEGRARLSTTPSSLIFVAAPRGFALRRVSSGETSVRIDVPPANASLSLTTVSIDGQPISGLSFLVRYDGEVIPPAAQLRLDAIPTGRYELWPYATSEEAEALMESVGAMAAPIVIDVVTGENRATVRLRPRQPSATSASPGRTR